MKECFHNRYLLPVLSGLALSFAVACGDDDPGTEPDADTAADGAPDDGADADTGDNPDADVDVREERQGTVAITETRVVDPDNTTQARAATPIVEFLDAPSEVTGDGCTVTTQEDDVPPQVDEGPITVTNTLVGEDDNGDSSFTCEYDGEEEEYRCDLAANDGLTMNLDSCTTDLGCPGDISAPADFLVIEDDNVAATHDLVGSHVDLENGFAPNISERGPYAILDQDYDDNPDGDADEASIFELAGVDGDDIPDDAQGDGSYTISVGEAAPDPAFAGEEPIFLQGEDTAEDLVTVEGPAGSENVAEFSVAGFPLGQGMVVAEGEQDEDDNTYLYVHPTGFLGGVNDVQDEGNELDGLRLSCDDGKPGDGVCAPEGVNIEDDVEGATAFVVSGTATDDTDDFVEFTCVATESQTVTISDEVLTAISDFGPDQVNTRVTYANGAVEQSDEEPFNFISVLVGNTVAGVSAAE